MGSTLTSKSASLHISPMYISQTTPHEVGGRMLGEATEDLQQQSKIVVHPGELCRVALEIKNWDSQPQHFTLKLEGTFPFKWCQLQTDVESEPQFGIALQKSVAQTSDTGMGNAIDSVTLEVAAKKSRHADLWFLIPEDFFEGQDALEEKGRKELDFQGCLSLYDRQSPSLGSTVPRLKKRTAHDGQLTRVEPGEIRVCDRSKSTGRALTSSSSHPIQESNFELNVRPRSTYTTFLPTVYQEVDYINRFINIFEQAFDPIVNNFTSMWAYLDPLTAPQTLLPFLAHWVDWPIDLKLDLTCQRRLIRRAVEIYRCRGTRKGLRFYLHLYTGLPLDEHIDREEDKSIGITEPFGQGCLFGLAYVGEDAIIGGGKPYHFDVRLRAQSDSPIDEQLVRRIIDREKPAFCSYSLRIETD